MADQEEKLTAAQVYIAKMEEALLVFGLNPQNETIDLRDCARAYARGRADEQAMLDTAQARVSELEKTLEAARSATQTYASLEAEVAKLSSAGIKVEPANDYTAEVHAARIDALKTLGVNPYDPPVCVIGAAKKKAKTLEHVQKLEDELAQIWELWGAGCPMTPGCVYEAAQEMERTATALRVKLGAIAEMLNDARIPTHYGRAQDGGPVPLPERVGLLTESNALAQAMVKRWTDAAMSEAEEAREAHVQLDDLGAPRCAGSASMTIAHRIRALPGLLRQE